MAYGRARGRGLPRDVVGLCCRRPREEILLGDGALPLQQRRANPNLVLTLTVALTLTLTFTLTLTLDLSLILTLDLSLSLTPTHP